MRSRWLGPLVVAAMLLFLAWAWPQLPARMAVHWNASFEVDRWGSRLSAAGVLPVMALCFWVVIPLLRRLDPRREHYERFDSTFWIVVNLLVLMLGVLEVAVVGFNLGWPIDMQQVVLGLVGLLLVAIGNYMPRMRSNWWMGIRTPWTLSSERVWRETHRLGGRTFVLGGLVTIAAAFLPKPVAPWVALGGLLVGGFVPVVYSYLLWRGEAGEAGSP